MNGQIVKITIELDDLIVDHMTGKDGSKCGAASYDPCAFSETILRRVSDAIKKEMKSA